MNTKQKITLGIGSLLLLYVLIFPPYSQTYPGERGSLGQVSDSIFGVLNEKPKRSGDNEINFLAWAVRVLLVGGAFGGVAYALRNKQDPES